MYCCMLQISRKTNVSCLRANGGEIARHKEDTNEGQNKGQIPPIYFSVAGSGKTQTCWNPANERLDKPHFALVPTKVQRGIRFGENGEPTFETATNVGLIDKSNRTKEKTEKAADYIELHLKRRAVYSKENDHFLLLKCL